MMTTDLGLRLPISATIVEHRRPWAETITSYEHELTELRRSETAMRAVLSCEGAVLHEKEELIQLLEILGKESDHRFLNSLQMIASLLSMQARTAVSPETASQLAIAADRVIMIGAIHRRLHCLDGTRTVAFKPYLDDLCGDFAKMLGAEDGSETIIGVDAIEAELPTVTAIPLGFIVSELITNAVKYGKGQIKLWLGRDGVKGYALSISNDGPSLPSGFDPTMSKGVGMKVIRSLVAKIGGKLQFGPGDQGKGADSRCCSAKRGELQLPPYLDKATTPSAVETNRRPMPSTSVTLARRDHETRYHCWASRSGQFHADHGKHLRKLPVRARARDDCARPLPSGVRSTAQAV